MVGNSALRLLFHVEPNKREHRHHRQRCNGAAGFAGALGNFRYQHHDAGSGEVFKDEPGHYDLHANTRIDTADNEHAIAFAAEAAASPKPALLQLSASAWDRAGALR